MLSDEQAIFPSIESEARNSVVDYKRWNFIRYRSNDIVIATAGKTGTTWMQQIVGQLIFQGDEKVAIGEVSPWIEYRGVPIERVVQQIERQSHRRFFKTHLAQEYVPMSDQVFYIYVARDVRDQIWSAHHHIQHLNSDSLALNEKSLRGSTERPRVPSIREYYHKQLNRTKQNPWPFWANVLSWWSIRTQPNVLLVHFANLKRNLEPEIVRIASFLNIAVRHDVWPQILRHVQFDYMKQNAEKIAGPGAEKFLGGATTLFNQGTNGRWQSVLTDKEIAKCDVIASANLPPDCASWLSTGILS